MVTTDASFASWHRMARVFYNYINNHIHVDQYLIEKRCVNIRERTYSRSGSDRIPSNVSRVATLREKCGVRYTA